MPFLISVCVLLFLACLFTIYNEPYYYKYRVLKTNKQLVLGLPGCKCEMYFTRKHLRRVFCAWFKIVVWSYLDKPVTPRIL